MESNNPSTNPPPKDPIVPWMELQHELSELHARLEYFRLMLKLAARRTAG